MTKEEEMIKARLAEELREMEEVEEEQRATAGREKEEMVNTAKKDCFARLTQVKKENEEREREAREEAEVKEAKLVLESQEIVKKKVAEKEALIKTRKEEGCKVKKNSLILCLHFLVRPPHRRFSCAGKTFPLGILHKKMCKKYSKRHIKG